MPVAKKRGSSSAPGIGLANSGGKVAVHGRDVHADLLEQPAVHHAHDAAAALGRGSRRLLRSGRRAEVRGRLVLQRLEGGADAVAQGFEPGAGAPFGFPAGSGSLSAGSFIRLEAESGKPSVCRSASPRRHGAAVTTFSERPPGQGDQQARVGGLVHLVGHAGALPAEQQGVARVKSKLVNRGAPPGGEQQDQPSARSGRAQEGLPTDRGRWTTARAT